MQMSPPGRLPPLAAEQDQLGAAGDRSPVGVRRGSRDLEPRNGQDTTFTILMDEID